MLDLGKVKGVKANTAHSETDNFMTKNLCHAAIVR